MSIFVLPSYIAEAFFVSRFAKEFVFKLFRDERDALIAWPGRIGHEMALDLKQKGNEPRVVIGILEKHVKRYLTGRAHVERPRSL